MYIVNETPEYMSVLDKIATPLILRLEQVSRMIQRKPSMQEDVLDRVVAEVKADQNLLAILLFGSVASGKQSWKSDIDLIFVYGEYDPPSGLINRWVDGIEVQVFFTTFDELVRNQEKVPYLLNMFCDAKILLDRNHSVTPVIEQIKQYFAANPDVAAEWIRLKELHQIEKKGPECQQTTIIQRWEEMENKYSGGKQKRTFFIA